MIHPISRRLPWGAATSAYQIEGSPLADGAGPSIWQRFVAHARADANGDTGDVACDHYRRFAEDVALMRELGLNAYRFSIAGAACCPTGTRPGEPGRARLLSPAGRRAARRSGIQPMVTLYHWDLPAALDDRGGWLNRDIADWFADYAAWCSARSTTGCELWATLNEPWVVTDGGYLHGALAPATATLRGADRLAQPAARARRRGRRPTAPRASTQIGLVVNLEPKYPGVATAPEDLAATRARRRVHEPAVPRSGLPRPLSGRAAPRSSAMPGPTARPTDFGSSGSRSTSSASTTTRAA